MQGNTLQAPKNSDNRWVATNTPNGTVVSGKTRYHTKNIWPDKKADVQPSTTVENIVAVDQIVTMKTGPEKGCPTKAKADTKPNIATRLIVMWNIYFVGAAVTFLTGRMWVLSISAGLVLMGSLVRWLRERRRQHNSNNNKTAIQCGCLFCTHGMFASRRKTSMQCGCVTCLQKLISDGHDNDSAWPTHQQMLTILDQRTTPKTKKSANDNTVILELTNDRPGPSYNIRNQWVDGYFTLLRGPYNINNIWKYYTWHVKCTPQQAQKLCGLVGIAGITGAISETVTSESEADLAIRLAQHLPFNQALQAAKAATVNNPTTTTTP